MSRRVSLPGADELFRNTATLSAVPSARETVETPTEVVTPVNPAKKTVRQTPRRRVNSFDRSPSGRERHDEKITVYISPEELYDLTADPEELRNLAAQPEQQTILEQLRQATLAELKRSEASFLDLLPPVSK